MQGGISSKMNQWTYFGLGPHQTYVDRKASGLTGVYSDAVEDSFYPYIDAQESGNRTSVRWAHVSSEAGGELRVDALGQSLLEVSLYPYAPDEIELARHDVDLTSGEQWWLNIDLQQMGLGGTNSWGHQPLPQYRLPGGQTYEYSFLLSYE